MAYLDTKHQVGAVVYAYQADINAVQRLRVTSISAKCTEPDYTPKWEVTYEAVCADSIGWGVKTYDAAQLFTDAARAFPVLDAEPASFAELEAA